VWEFQNNFIHFSCHAVFVSYNPGVTCVFCNQKLFRSEVELSSPFPCPRCRQSLRVRRNYALRILRLGLIAPVMIYLAGHVASTFNIHIQLRIFSPVEIGVIDEFLMRFLPAKLEPEFPGSLITGR
jgi:hypothetical protein